VVMPFLPGDSLLFIVGALCGAGCWTGHWPPGLNAAGRHSGPDRHTPSGATSPKVFQWETLAFSTKNAFNQAHTSTTLRRRRDHHHRALHALCPHLRAIRGWRGRDEPAGKFTMYNVVGAVIWLIGLTAAGYFFGNLPWCRQPVQRYLGADHRAGPDPMH